MKNGVKALPNSLRSRQSFGEFKLAISAKSGKWTAEQVRSTFELTGLP